MWPLIPILLKGVAVAAAALGVGKGIKGAVKMKEANDKLKEAQERDKRNLARLKKANENACAVMDLLGRHEMEILSSFGEFSSLFERIHNKPSFASVKIGSVTVPTFNKKEIEDASVGANVLLGGLGGAALGTAGAFAASGATTAAVMTFGTAGTGAAISGLSGVAATNATLAVLGGGTLASGGGGVAAGTMLLGAATFGVGLLIGGIIFDVTGSAIDKKADKAVKAMQDNENKINSICSYLNELISTAGNYDSVLMQVNSLYASKMASFKQFMGKYMTENVNWSALSDKEQSIVEEVVLFVGVLYNMCKVKLVKKSTNKNGINRVNHTDIEEALNKATPLLP